MFAGLADTRKQEETRSLGQIPITPLNLERLNLNAPSEPALLQEQYTASFSTTSFPHSYSEASLPYLEPAHAIENAIKCPQPCASYGGCKTFAAWVCRVESGLMGLKARSSLTRMVGAAGVQGADEGGLM